MKKKIPFISLVLLIVAAIDSLRNLPSAALFGSSLIFFFLFSALLFLIPTALVAAELSAIFPEKGGIYYWVHRAFGEKWALLAIWLQWINTMIWYPTILLFVSGVGAYLIDPNLVHHKGYLLLFSLTLFWTITFLNWKGIYLSTLINNLCVLLGTIFPILFLIGLTAVWISSGASLQIEFTWDKLLPSFHDSNNWIALIAIMASFLGMELSGVHVNEIRSPQKNFPRAILLASFFILISMTLGSLAVAVVIPRSEIELSSGVMQLFSRLFSLFGFDYFASWLTPLLIFIGSVGAIINWLISPAKGLLHAAEFGFLPLFFTRTNKAGVPVNILLIQAILVSLFCLVFFFVPTVNSSYWFLTALSTELYMVMYILMFAAALFLHYKYIKRPAAFKIPGGSFGIWLVASLGMFGCIATITVTFLPPEHIPIIKPWLYLLFILIGNLVALLPLPFLYRCRRPDHHRVRL